jgi:hypothetical protein
MQIFCECLLRTRVMMLGRCAAGVTNFLPCARLWTESAKKGVRFIPSSFCSGAWCHSHLVTLLRVLQLLNLHHCGSRALSFSSLTHLSSENHRSNPRKWSHFCCMCVFVTRFWVDERAQTRTWWFLIVPIFTFSVAKLSERGYLFWWWALNCSESLLLNSR